MFAYGSQMGSEGSSRRGSNDALGSSGIVGMRMLSSSLTALVAVPELWWKGSSHHQKCPKDLHPRAVSVSHIGHLAGPSRLKSPFPEQGHGQLPTSTLFCQSELLIGRPVCFCLVLFHLADFDFCGVKLKIKLYFNCSCHLTGFCDQTFCSHLEIHGFYQSLSRLLQTGWRMLAFPFPCSHVKIITTFPRRVAFLGWFHLDSSLREDRARCWALGSSAPSGPPWQKSSVAGWVAVRGRMTRCLARITCYPWRYLLTVFISTC